MHELSFKCLQQLLFYRTVYLLIVPSVSCMNFISIFLFYVCYVSVGLRARVLSTAVVSDSLRPHGL